jgi:hypothetical protein
MSVPIKIDQPIVGYSVVKKEEAKASPALIGRQEVLPGRTYKVKTPLSESALYVTINHCEIDGVMRPFEIFINCKDMKHFQWVVALTRLISAVFRHGGEVAFLIEELRSVLDPNGGAFHKGKYIPSLVSVIGDVIEQELTSLGLFKRDESLKEAAVAMVKEKIEKTKKIEHEDDGYPVQATVCQKCMQRSVVIMDSCSVCLNCSESKCG